MRYRKLSPTGDYTFGFNADDFYTGTEAVAQAIYTALKLKQGEWWEDTQRGLPLFQQILAQAGTPEHQHAVDMLVQETILKVPGVQAIAAFQSYYADRQYTFNATIQSVYGDVVLKEVQFSP